MENKSTKLTMGVGNGTGNLFVEGDYDSITTLQNKLLELENLRKKSTKINNLTFSEALDLLKLGSNITREEWIKSKGTFIFLVPGSNFKVNRPPLNVIFKEGSEISYNPHIDICTGNNVSVWVPTQSDLLAEDYQVAS